MNKAIFLDRDGTLNVDKRYLYKIDDFEFLPGVIPSLRQLQAAGFFLIIITNQSGIARGYYGEEEFLKLNEWMIGELEAQGVEIKKVYYCPHHPDSIIKKYRKSCDCRKPMTSLFEQAVEEFDLDLDKCFAIGDKLRDCSICEESDCRGYLITENETADVIERVKAGRIRNVSYARSFREAADEIIYLSHSSF